jgi:hypothetical protein
MKLGIATIAATLVAVVSCAAFEPQFNKRDWPCGDPQAKWCPGHKTCCSADLEDCGGSIEFVGCPAGYCCANGGETAAPGERRIRPQTVAQ